MLQHLIIALLLYTSMCSLVIEKFPIANGQISSATATRGDDLYVTTQNQTTIIRYSTLNPNIYTEVFRSENISNIVAMEFSQDGSKLFVIGEMESSLVLLSLNATSIPFSSVANTSVPFSKAGIRNLFTTTSAVGLIAVNTTGNGFILRYNMLSLSVEQEVDIKRVYRVDGILPDTNFVGEKLIYLANENRIVFSTATNQWTDSVLQQGTPVFNCYGNTQYIAQTRDGKYLCTLENDVPKCKGLQFYMDEPICGGAYVYFSAVYDYAGKCVFSNNETLFSVDLSTRTMELWAHGYVPETTCLHNSNSSAPIVAGSTFKTAAGDYMFYGSAHSNSLARVTIVRGTVATATSVPASSVIPKSNSATALSSSIAILLSMCILIIFP